MNHQKILLSSFTGFHNVPISDELLFWDTGIVHLDSEEVKQAEKLVLWHKFYKT